MSFGQGFVTGLADSLATGLKDDMEKTYDKISQMSALRAKTIVEGSQKHRSEEHTSELQSRLHLVCRLLLEKKKKNQKTKKKNKKKQKKKKKKNKKKPCYITKCSSRSIVAANVRVE